jgi:hypothetical protein
MAEYDFSNISPADLLSLEYAEEEARKQAENRVNTFKRLMGQRGTWSASRGSPGTTALTSYSKGMDLRHLEHIQKKMSAVVGTTALPYNDPKKFNTWYKDQEFPYRFIKDLRASYKNVSDQFRASEKHPGEMTLQERQIEAGEHQAALEAGEIESQQLGLEKERADLAAGKKREFNRGNEVITEVFKDGRWVFYSSAPRWDAEATTKQQDFGFYIDQVNEARKKEGLLPLTDREEADIFNKYFLKEQIETSQAWTPPMIKEFSDKKTAFSDTTGMIKRMLVQLANPEVVIGTVASLFKGIEAIGSQFRQLARSFGEDALIDPKQYDFGKAEYSGQLQANITGLAYTLAKAVEGGKLSESDVQLRIKMITGGGMSKDTMTANLMEIYNNSVRGIENAYLSAREAGLPGSKVYTVGEFLDTRKAGTLLIEPEIKGGKQTGIMALGYYASDGKFHPITHWYDESQVQ